MLFIFIVFLFIGQLHGFEFSLYKKHLISWSHYKQQLATACNIGDCATVKTLFKRGLSSNTKYQNRTPLNRAVCNLHIDLVQLLLENNANPNLASRFAEDLPLHNAINHLIQSDFGTFSWLDIVEVAGIVSSYYLNKVETHYRIIALLLSYGANPEAYGVNPHKDFQKENMFQRALGMNNINLLELGLQYNTSLDYKKIEEYIQQTSFTKMKKLLIRHQSLQEQILTSPHPNFHPFIMKYF